MPDPIILSTWRFGQQANAAGWPYLSGAKPSALDAVEQACRAVEADPEVTNVGRGGYPDRSGEVTLDASIMLSPAQCGSVCYVRRYLHAISIARLVMEKSPHTMLAGDGADRFAKLHGMEPCDLLTDRAQAAWRKWLAEHPVAQQLEHKSYLPPAPLNETWPDTEAERHHLAEEGRQPRSPLPLGEGQGEGFGEGRPSSAVSLANFEERTLPDANPEHHPRNQAHDTVGVLALDSDGQLAGACSTSGMPLKLPGRVGDSPIIGHGLYVDPRYGAAVATGLGELIMGVCGAFLAVEQMRHGASPLEAAAEILQRIVDSYVLREEHLAAIITLAPDGRWSSAALRPGYHTAVRTATRDEVIDPERVMLV